VSRRERWVLLVYRLPREPSTPRIAVWRKLKRLGVAQMSDGLVALPLDARTREQLEWIADEVVEAGGEATVWLAEPAGAAQQRVVVSELAAARAEEYQAVTDAATVALADAPAAQRRTLGRLRRELRRIARRDYFPPPQRQQARDAVAALAASAVPRGSAVERAPGRPSTEETAT
jgi:uncharacterized protein YdbL (DUF1318 family)